MSIRTDSRCLSTAVCARSTFLFSRLRLCRDGLPWSGIAVSWTAAIDGHSMIVGLTIRNFRSIREIVDLPLRDFHVLVGPNGSGKSSFMDAITFVRDCLVMGPAGAVAARNITDFNDLTWMRRGGAVEIGLWLDLGRERPKPSEVLLRYTVSVEQHEIGRAHV